MIFSLIMIDNILVKQNKTTTTTTKKSAEEANTRQQVMTKKKQKKQKKIFLTKYTTANSFNVRGELCVVATTVGEWRHIAFISDTTISLLSETLYHFAFISDHCTITGTALQWWLAQTAADGMQWAVTNGPLQLPVCAVQWPDTFHTSTAPFHLRIYLLLLLLSVNSYCPARSLKRCQKYAEVLQRMV